MTWFFPFMLLTAFTPANSGNVEQCLKPPYHGITETSVNGELTGKIDRNDWGCFDSTGRFVEATGTLSVPPLPPPTRVCLGPAFPNPASGAVRLTFTLPAATSVRLTIMGQTRGHGRPEALAVRTLMDASLMSGVHEVTWDLRNDQGARVPPGIYRVVLDAQGVVLCGDIEVQ